MKTPSFWQRNTLLSTALLPFSGLYHTAASLRAWLHTPVTLCVPVFCIGNLTAGGAGKTPVALHVGHKLRERGVKAFFLSRGYGGSIHGPALVSPQRHSAREVGDEPLLLAQCLPTVVAKHRLTGAQWAIAQGAQAIVMDDGLQNRSIAKTLPLVVIDGKQGFGNGRLLPAGPLREPVASGLKRAAAAIVINPCPPLPPLPAHLRVLHACTQPAPSAYALKGRTVVAFCGIAYPEKFFDTLSCLGADIVSRHAYPDHYPYTRSDLEAIMAKAKELDATPVTTAKDAVRLPPEFRAMTHIVDITLAFENEDMLDRLLETALHGHVS